MCFLLFGCRFVALRNSVQNGNVWLPYETRCKTGRTSAKVRATKSCRNFSQRTLRIHPIGPLTDVLVRFVLFGSIRKPFGCLTKLSTKRDELVQKFVPRSCVGIPRNERTRSPPLDPKLPFWCVSYYWVHSGLFGCLTKLDAKRAELVQKFVPRSRVGIIRNERRSTPLDPKLTFWCVSYYLGAFGTICMPYETWCKTCRTSAKVRATRSRRNFSQ